MGPKHHDLSMFILMPANEHTRPNDTHLETKLWNMLTTMQKFSRSQRGIDTEVAFDWMMQLEVDENQGQVNILW